jgi:predicted nucleic acid-binding protein
MQNALIFVDTNIFLDFYRAYKDVSLSLLRHIENNHDRFITTNQVEMEYKKNRQRVIVDSLSRFRTPNWDALTVPSFLTETQASKTIEKNKKDIVRQQGTLRKRIDKVLRHPSRNDDIYKVLQKVFLNTGPYNLTRKKKIRGTIRDLARTRFTLGYPPRKKYDTSMGDAINWEWIIHCAIDSGKNVIIVSRDSDYGVNYSSEPILNDWLQQEFRERVSRKRKIALTDRLSQAFKMASISVTKKETELEKKLIEDIRTYPATVQTTLREQLDMRLKEFEEQLSRRRKTP